MYIERKHTAILVFSLSAHEEKGRKNMFGRHQNFTNKRTFELLIHLTKKTVKNSKVDVIWIGEKEQKGNSFGERFTNAFLQLFDQGYEKVIAIGKSTEAKLKEFGIAGALLPSSPDETGLAEAVFSI